MIESNLNRRSVFCLYTQSTKAEVHIFMLLNQLIIIYQNINELSFSIISLTIHILYPVFYKRNFILFILNLSSHQLYIHN